MGKLRFGVIGCAGQMGMAHLLFLNNAVADSDIIDNAFIIIALAT